MKKLKDKRIEIKDEEDDEDFVGLGISIGTMIGSAAGAMLSMVFENILFLGGGISLGLLIGTIIASAHQENNEEQKNKKDKENQDNNP